MVLPLIAIGVGTVALAGVAIGGLALTPVEDSERELEDELELGLIRLGYITEGIVKGTIVAAPASVLIVLLVSLGASGLNWVGARGDFNA